MPKKNEQQKITHNKTLLEWHAPEFIPHKRGKVWYIVISTIILGLLIYSIIDRVFTMTVGLLLVVTLLFLNHRRKPKVMKVRITELGVEYGNRSFAYHDIQAFWVIYKPPYVRSLYLRLGGKEPKLVHIELNHQDPVEVRKILAKELPEIEGASQPYLDILSRLIRLT